MNKLLLGLVMSLAVMFSMAADAQTAQPAQMGYLTTSCGTAPTPCFVQYGSTLPVSGSFSATLSGFTPNGNYATPLAVTTTTGNVALPSGTSVLVQNVGSNVAYVNLGTSGAVTATTSSIAVPAGGGCSLTVGSNTFLAAITASSTTTLNLAGGTGLGNACYGGGSSGGAGSSNITQWNGNTVSLNNGATDAGTLRVTVSNDSTGKLAATQSGTWNITNVSGTVSLPTGASTSALQTTGNTALTTINTTLGSPMQNSGGSVTANIGTIGNVASAANQTAVQGSVTGGSAPSSTNVSGALYNSTQPSLTNGQSVAIQVDAKGNTRGVVMDAAGNGRGANVDASNNLGVVVGEALPAGSNSIGTVVLGAGAATIGALTANQSVNVNQLAGTTTDTNSGSKSAGTLRVVIATDQPALTNSQPVNLTQVAGASVVASASGVQEVGIVGNAGATLDASAAQNVTAPTNGILTLGQFNTSPTTITNGKVSPIQLDNAGRLIVNCTSGCGGSGGTSIADEATFTQGTTSITPIGGIYTTSVTNLTTGQAGVVQLTNDRKMKTAIFGNTGAVMDAAGQNASSPANELLIAGQFNTSPTTISSGNVSPFQLDSAGNLLVNVKAGGGSGGTSSTFGAAFPGTGTAIGASNGGNMVYLAADGSHNLDVNCAVGCSGGTFNNNADAVATSSSNGQAAAWNYVWNGTTWDRLYGDTTNGAFVNVKTGTVTANAGTNLNTSLLALESGGNLATIAGAITSSIMQGNLKQVNGTTTASNNGTTNAGTLRVTISSDSTGTVAASQSGAWNITNVSGTVSLPTGASTAANQTSVIGTKAAGTAATNSLLTGGVFNTSAPTLTNGQQAAVQMDSSGNTLVNVAVALPAGGNTIGAVTQASGPWTSNITQVAGSSIATGHGTASGTIRVELPTDGTGIVGLATGANTIGAVTQASGPWTINETQIGGTTILTGGVNGSQGVGGLAASGASASGNPVQVGGVYSSAQITALTNGQAGAMQVDVAGNHKVAPGISFNNSVAAWTNGTSGNTTATLLTNHGAPAIQVMLAQTSTISGGAITFEGSYDGTNFITVPAQQVLDPAANLAPVAIPYTLVASTNKAFIVVTGGFEQVRIKLSTAITGSATVTVSAALLPYAPTQGANLTQVAGTATDSNSGTKSAGTLRVVLATDQPALTNKLLVTPDANSSINFNQLGGNAVSAGNGTSGTGVLRVTVASDSTGQIALAAGSQLVGKVGIDQTTPGTTNAVSLAQLGANTIATGNGTSSTGTLRVAIASDNTANSNPFLVQPVPGTANGLTMSTLTAANSTNATNVKASAGTVYHIEVYNNSATLAWLSLYNNSGTPTCGTSIVWQTMIPANSTSGAGAVVDASLGLAFSSGIAYCVTTGIAGTGSVAASSYVIDVGYK